MTIDHTKVPSTQSNFTVLVSVTDPALKTVANGGHVANANGYDIGFYADSGGNTKLKWEVEKYDGTSGNLIAWVKIPSVSSSSDTVFYLMYGNSSINTDQSDPPNTWDSNFKGVWHMADSAANTTIRESTVTGANGTNNANTSSKTATGQIGNALSYNGSTDGSFAAINLSATNIVTLSFWMKWTTNANDDDLAFEYTPNYNTNAATDLLPTGIPAVLVAEDSRRAWAMEISPTGAMFSPGPQRGHGTLSSWCSIAPDQPIRSTWMALCKR